LCVWALLMLVQRVFNAAVSWMVTRVGCRLELRVVADDEPREENALAWVAVSRNRVVDRRWIGDERASHVELGEVWKEPARGGDEGLPGDVKSPKAQVLRREAWS
jgi:hypothetical protein